jgi:hypothetical protein
MKKQSIQEATAAAVNAGLRGAVPAQTQKALREARDAAKRYTLIGRPRVQPEYCDEWETVMVIDLRRDDGEEGDVWIVAGVPDYRRGSSAAAGTQDGYQTVRVFGNSPDTWCPDNFDADDDLAILDACMAAALRAHRERL